MSTILLTCCYDDFDLVLDVKRAIERRYGIPVMLNVEDDGDDEDEGLDAMIELATVLFIFEFGESCISAWVTIEGVNMEDSNYQQSPFPESIDFSSVNKGIAMFENIVYEDFGIDLTPQETYVPLVRDYTEVEWY